MLSTRTGMARTFCAAACICGVIGSIWCAEVPGSCENTICDDCLVSTCCTTAVHADFRYSICNACAELDTQRWLLIEALMCRLTSADGNVEFVFQHNVCGRSIYAEGTVDAALFLAKKVQEKSEQRIFDMIDVLKAGAMR